MNRKLCGLGGAVAAAALLWASPASVSAETLQEALAAAYSSNPTLLAEQAKLRATDEGVNQAISGWRPTITLSADYGPSESRRQTSRSFFGTGLGTSVTTKTYIRDYNYGAQISQPLFRGFKTINSTKQAKARVWAGRANLWSVEQQVLLDAVTAYVDVIRDQATVDLNGNNVGVLNRQQEASQDRFRVGEVTRTDVAQADARLSLAQSDLANAQAAWAQTRARYEAIIGRAPVSLQAPPPLPDMPKNLDEAIATAIDNNPTLIAAQENEKAAKHAVDIAMGDLLPSVNLNANLSGNEEIPQKNTQSLTWSTTATLTIPIYQGGAEYSRLRQAKHTHSQSRILVAEARRSVVQSITASFETMLAAQARIVSDEQQVRANQIAFDGVQQEAQVGARTTLDVLDAEQELLNAQVALARSQRDTQVAAYQVLSSLGRLTAKDLGLAVDLYDPDINYRDVNGKWIGWNVNGD